MASEKSLSIGAVRIGGGAPVVVQSMTNTDTRDAAATLSQLRELAEAGCEVARVAVPDEAAAAALPAIRAKSPLPLVADIHFSSRLAVAALEAGVHALRINPGNIGGREKIRRVVDAARAHGASIRVGVNAGSLEKKLLERFGGPTPEAMVESALRHVRMLEDLGFEAIKISLKSSHVTSTVAAYRLLAARCGYPLHIGVTEAGTLLRGAVKSAVGLGILLAEGIGDTLRVSLTHDPVREVEVAWRILAALDLRRRGPDILSCPTCGRTEIDVIGLAEEVERRLRGIAEPFSVAVMGCVVNGPGEAREADVGIAGGRGKGVLFRKGRPVRSVTGGREELLRALLEEIALFRGGESLLSVREETKIPDADGMADPRPGLYRHYKGKMYRVLGSSRHSETEEDLVVYRALYGERGLWVRPRSMFTEQVSVGGSLTARFAYVGEGEKECL